MHGSIAARSQPARRAISDGRAASLLDDLAAPESPAPPDPYLLGRRRDSYRPRSFPIREPAPGPRSLIDVAVAAERSRIARDLHDGLVQDLSSLNFRLQSIEQELTSASPEGRVSARDQLAEVRRQVCYLYDEVRSTIGTLQATEKPRLQFNDELTRIVQAFAERSGIPVALHLETRAFSPPTLIGLEFLRIVEEALVNVQKHSGAARVCVVLRAHDHCIELIVKDEGAGFKVEEAHSPRGHFGLDVMRERAQEIGARLAICSEEGQGTMVAVSLPVW